MIIGFKMLIQTMLVRLVRLVRQVRLVRLVQPHLLKHTQLT